MKSVRISLSSLEGNGRYERQGHSLLFRRGSGGRLDRCQGSYPGPETFDRANPARLGDKIGMPRVYLQEMFEDIRLDGLPVNWITFDISQFSRNRTWEANLVRKED